MVSAYRPDVPIVTFTPSAKIARQLIIHRGIHPVVGKLSGISFHKRPAVAIKYAKDMGFVQSGDNVVVVGIEDNEDEEDWETIKLKEFKDLFVPHEIYIQTCWRGFCMKLLDLQVKMMRGKDCST